ncbi:MAG: LLM class flavin-dependent oxidoreductase [Actinobacteria bacterium]|nr:LLM class flavin-dependent oxidoreductase [Actinomycetota bacterium]MCG2803746.1 LLM class flavin-dependent oxidoreductase [Cellulomonas sp.]
MPTIAVMLPRDLPPGQVTAYARRAEALGFEALWVVEDLGFRGGIAQATAVLATTSTIRVGIGVLPAAVRNPAFAAMELATLAQLFPGRLDVGIGHGMPGWLRSVGAWPRTPLRLLEEHLVTVRALLNGERVDAPDALVPIEGFALDPAAVPEVVPPLLAGVRGPRSLAMSGRVADGTVLAEPCTPEYVRAAVEQIAAPGPHAIVTYNVGSVHDHEGTALAQARPGLAWIGEPDWAPHLAPLPFGAELAALRASCGSQREFAARLPDAWVARLALAGTPDGVRTRLGELAAAGVTSSVFIPAAPDPLTGLDQLARVL